MDRGDQLSTLSKFVIGMNQKSSQLCIPTQNGLEMGLDGVRLMPQPSTFSAPFGFSTGSGDVHWTVHLRQAGTGQDISVLEQAEWVLIPYVGLATNAIRHCRAVIVKVDQWRPDKRSAKPTFKALATLSRLELDEARTRTSALPRLAVRYPTRPRDWTNLNTTKERAEDVRFPVAAAMGDLHLCNERWIVG